MRSGHISTQALAQRIFLMKVKKVRNWLLRKK